MTDIYFRNESETLQVQGNKKQKKKNVLTITCLTKMQIADRTSSLLTGMILIFLEHFNAADNVFETGL